MYQGKPEENPENREEMFSLSNNEEDKELFARNKTTLHKLSPQNHEVTESVNKQLSNVFNASFSTITHSATPTLKGARPANSHQKGALSSRSAGSAGSILEADHMA